VPFVLLREQQDVSHALAMKKKSSEKLSLQLPAGCKFAARVCLPTPGKLQSKPASASFSEKKKPRRTAPSSEKNGNDF